MKTRSRRGVLRPGWATLVGSWALCLAVVVLWLQPPFALVMGQVLGGGDGRGARIQVLVRGVTGPAQGRVWTTYAGDDGRFRLPVSPGVVEIEAGGRDYEGGRSTPPQRLVLRDGERRRLKLTLPAWRLYEEQLSIVMPQRAFYPDEAPSFGLHGTVPKGVKSARVTVERVAFEQVLADKRAQALFESWHGSLGADFLRQFGPYLTRLSEQTVELKTAGGGSRFHVYGELPRRGPGLYLATVVVDDLAQRVAFQITELALVAKADGRTILGFACGLRRGEARAGVTLQLWHRRRGLVRTATTDAHGLASFTPDAGGDDSYVLVARAGEHSARCSVYVSPPGDSSRVTHLYTDRPVYRPGQKVYLKGIVRDRTPQGFVVPPGQPVKLTVNDGRGDELYRLYTETSPLGTFHYEFDIPEEAFAGDFWLHTSVNGATESLTIPVKAYVKPVYKVRATVPTRRVVRGATPEVSLAAEYFFGTPVGGAEVRYTVRRQTEWWQPWLREGEAVSDEQWAEEIYESFREEEGEGEGGHDRGGQEVLTGTARTDDNGRFTLALPTAQLVAAASAPGLDGDGRPLEPETTLPTGLVVEFHVLDGTGRNEAAFGSVVVLPSAVALGVQVTPSWLKPGEHAKARVIARDIDGQPVARCRLTTALYRRYSVADCRLRWKDDPHQPWLRPEVPPGPYQGCADPRHCPYDHGHRSFVDAGPRGEVVTDSKGFALVPLQPTAEGTWIVSVAAADEAGQWQFANGYCHADDDARRDNCTPGPDLTVLADRPRYQPGETAKVRVRSPWPDATVLLTHEGQVLAEPQVLTGQRAVEGKVALGAADIPNGIVDAVAVRDKKLIEREHNLRVDLRAKRLEVQVIASKAKAAPRDEVIFTVTTRRADQPVDAEVSLAVVDESLFAIRADRPERVVTAFYGRHWNRVGTFFSAPEAYFAADKDPDGAVRRHFPDTALWRPCLRTGAAGSVQVSLRLPDNLTTWRATAIGVSAATEVGFGTTSLLVSKPLMAQIECPRFLTQRDRSQVTVQVHNDTGADREVEVRLQPGTLFTTDRLVKSVAVPAGGRGRLVWPVRADQPVNTRLRASARAGDYHDAVERLVPVNAYAFARTVTERGTLAAGKATTVRLELPLGSELDASELHLTAASSVAGVLAGATETLLEYPYGCVEQTTSRFAGVLALARAYDALGWRREHPLDARSVTSRVKAGLLRLRKLQGDQGAWGWWEGREPDLYMTAYALSGILQAQAAGLALPGSMLEDGAEALAELLNRPPVKVDSGKQVAEAFDTTAAACAVEVLTLTPQAQRARPTLARLLEGKERPTIEGISRVVLAARRLGDPVLVREAERQWRLRLAEADWSQTCIGDVALALRASLALQGAGPEATKLARLLEGRYENRGWACTRDTCLAVVALADWLAATGVPRTEAKLQVTINGQALAPYTFDLSTARGRGAVFRVSGGGLRPGTNTVELSLTGSGEVRYVCGARAAVGGARLPRKVSDLSIERSYHLARRPGGGRWDYTLVTGPVQEQSLLRVMLTVRAKKEAKHVLIEDPLPAGCEAIDEGEGDWRWFELGWSWAARDFRDDRVAFFFDRLHPGVEQRLGYLLRAVVPGTYCALPTKIEPMYHPRDGATGADATMVIR